LGSTSEEPEGTIDGIASAALSKRGGDRPAAREAIRMLKDILPLSAETALQEERAAFQALRLGEDAFALRHVFFAERAVAKSARQPSTAVRPINQVAVVGAGTMGTGIAIAALEGGYAVTLADTNAEALDRGMTRVREHIQGRVAKGRMTSEEADAASQRLQGQTDLTALSSADLIIEAVFEDLAVKAQVFQTLDRVARPAAILATNTSYLSVTAIAEATTTPERVVGLHFFSPANVMRLVEVVRTARIAPDVLATAFAFGKSLGKQPILSADSFGFIGNRIYAAYRRQCEFMLEEGALPEEIDGALEAYGFAMGPFAVADLSGLDIAWRMRQATASSRDPEARYVEIPDILCQRERLGRKTGAGYYRYDDKGRRTADPEVTAVILAESERKATTRRPFTAADIVQRVLTTMANEAAHLLAASVPERAEDMDLVLLTGYGFPKWKGGPVFQARRRGLTALTKDFQTLADVSGPGFPMADPRVLFPDDLSDSSRDR
jgi:3-hydroxyacyl-CoA dehydrogenase